jgi:predicted Zn-dependent protease
MKRLHYIVVIFTILLGVAASFVLIPRRGELALINFKESRFEEARADYEKRVAAGDLSASVVNPLSELYLQFGMTDEAISLLEKYMQANPSDPDARERLAKYYDLAQRRHDYRTTLEQLVVQEPTEARLRELNEIYSFSGEEELEIANQKKITELFPGNPDDLLRLAKLQASAQRFVDAGRTLNLFSERHADRVTADTIHFLVSVLLDANRAEEAITRIKVWLRQHPSADGAARLAGTLDLRNQSEAALQIVESFEKYAAQSPELLVQLVHLQVKTGRADKAVERLTRMYEAKQLPHQAVEPFLSLLIARGNHELALKVAETSELALLPDWLLANLADAAIFINRPDFALKMVTTLGEGFLGTNPLLGARLALLRSDAGAARGWLERAEAQLGDAGTVQQRRDLAGLYTEAKLPKDALRVLDALRRLSPTLEISSAWAVAAAQNGRGNEAAAWLAQLDPAQPSVATLTDLYFVGQDNNDIPLFLAAADRLLKRTRNDENLLRYANALIRAGRTAEALPLTRDLFAAKPSDDRESLYLTALTAAREAKQPVEAEIGAFWARKLAAAGVDPARREQIVFALLDANASQAALPDLARLAREKPEQWLSAYKDAALKANRKPELIEFLKTELRRTDKTIPAKESLMFTLVENGTDADTLPFLRQFAEQLGGTWNFSYEEALARNGRKDELRDFWLARAGRPGANREDRYLIGVRLLESGYKPEAERILMDIAKDMEPSAREVSQLLFLWGPRPPAYGLDWLEERVKAEQQGSARAQWIEYLLNAAAPQRVAALAANDPALLDAYIRALTALSDGANLTKVLLAQLPRIEQPETLRQYARRSLEVSESETARAYFTKLAVALPQDRETLRWLGALNYAIGQWKDAEDYYRRYFALNVTDHESEFYFGEILLRKADFAGANSHFERALQQIEQATTKTFAMRAVRAVTLDRIGKTDEAIAEYEPLVKERPKDKNLRADFAGLLIRERRLKDADRVLSLQ